MARTERTLRKLRKPRQESFDREMELTEHLAELRTRIIRVLVYIALGMVVTWIYYQPILDALEAPILRVKTDSPWRWIFTNMWEPFMLRLQISLAASVVLTFPLLFKEAWGFVAPALTRSERKIVYLLGPLCVLLFLSGVASAFLVLPRGIAWFLTFLPEGTELMQRLNDYVIFLAKSCLAFGAVFQLPVVMLFLGRFGLVNSRFLTKYWRQAIVLSAAAAAIITPSADAFTMVAMMAPLTVLYGLSIFLVKLVERKGDATDDPAGAEE